jgi:hypothetical protein
MLPAVQFHNQLFLDTAKVSDKRTDRMLTAKLRAHKLSIAQARP